MVSSEILNLAMLLIAKWKYPGHMTPLPDFLRSKRQLQFCRGKETDLPHSFWLKICIRELRIRKWSSSRVDTYFLFSRSGKHFLKQ
jgi:hypothetical protein